MLDVYVIGHWEGVRVVRTGHRTGPFTDLGAVLDALGPPTHHTENLADMAYALLMPDADTSRIPAAADGNPQTRALDRRAR